MQQQQNKSIKYKSIQIIYRSVLLTLHRNFTTAHSTSATRVNFFIQIAYTNPVQNNKIYGYGQCGLPPKKPGCYMSDINDCYQFMTVLSKQLQSNNQQNGQILDIPTNVSNKFQQLSSHFTAQILQLLRIIQKHNKIQHFRAPKCALQFALIDLFTRYHHIRIQQLLFTKATIPQEPSISFYTASLQQNQHMIENIVQHLTITKYIKIKYHNNIQKLLELLAALCRIKFNKQQNSNNERNGIKKIIIDANCSWNVDDYQQFIQGVKKLQDQDGLLINKILYIEQPFSLELDDIPLWKQVKNKSIVKILADESFRNQHDIQKVIQVAHAVNIKTQKTGGIFASLNAALKARQAGLQIMFGSMCSTKLGSTQTFQFWPLAHYLDIDGSLLVKDPNIQGGYQWMQDGNVGPIGGQGLGVKAAKLFI